MVGLHNTVCVYCVSVFRGVFGGCVRVSVCVGWVYVCVGVCWVGVCVSVCVGWVCVF